MSADSTSTTSKGGTHAAAGKRAASMQAADAGSIRAVSRALQLLTLLNQHPALSLGELHRQSGLPKPTVHRLLSALKGEGYVCTEGSAGVYRVTEKVRELGGGYTERSRVVDVGAPIARRVTREIKWPLAIGTLDHSMVVVRYSTMPYSPLAVQATTVGHRLSLFESAMGIAYLAACDDVERRALLDNLRRAVPDYAPSDEVIDQALRTVRHRGYGLRLPQRRGTSATVAVPIMSAPRAGAPATVIGALGMTTFGGSMDARLLSEHAPMLKATAREIGIAASG